MSAAHGWTAAPKGCWIWRGTCPSGWRTASRSGIAPAPGRAWTPSWTRARARRSACSAAALVELEFLSPPQGSGLSEKEYVQRLVTAHRAEGGITADPRHVITVADACNATSK